METLQVEVMRPTLLFPLPFRFLPTGEQIVTPVVHRALSGPEAGQTTVTYRRALEVTQVVQLTFPKVLTT